MAASKNIQELKEQAIRDLMIARTEMGAEAHWARQHLNPSVAMHRFVDNHTVGMLFSSLALGFCSSLLLIRSRSERAAAAAAHARAISSPAALFHTPPTPSEKKTLAAVLGGVAWTLVRGPLIHYVTKQISPLVNSYVDQWMAKSRAEHLPPGSLT